jgi:hypothetical protein
VVDGDREAEVLVDVARDATGLPWGKAGTDAAACRGGRFRMAFFAVEQGGDPCDTGAGRGQVRFDGRQGLLEQTGDGRLLLDGGSIDGERGEAMHGLGGARTTGPGERMGFVSHQRELHGSRRGRSAHGCSLVAMRGCTEFYKGTVKPIPKG